MKSTGNPNVNTAEYWDYIYGTPEKRKHYENTGTDQEAEPTPTYRFEYALRYVQPSHKVLDLGCGVGTFAKMVKTKQPASRVWGVDISPKVIEANKKEHYDISWLVGEVGKLEIGEQDFDLVFSGETLEHLDNPQDLFIDTAKLLKEGGKLIVTTPLRNIIRSPEHQWIFDYADIEKLYAENGFTDVEFLYLPSPETKLIIMAVGRKASKTDKPYQVGRIAKAQTITLDFHDFSVENNNIYYLDQLKRTFPKLKVSMFYIPFDVAYFERLHDFQRQEAIKLIKDRLDWIELIPHGLTHQKEEMLHIKDDNYEVVFAAIEEAFKTYDLSMVKGFCAPQWLYKQSLVDFLDKRGWWLAVDRNQPNLPKTKRFYEYTHSIDEPYWVNNNDVLQLHGHISGPSTNDLPNNVLNMFKINPEAEFKFVSELIK